MNLATNPLYLNDRYRITEDQLQWMLETRNGKTGGWRGRKFNFSRDALIRNIITLCGEVDPKALEEVRGWPENHRKWREWCHPKPSL